MNHRPQMYEVDKGQIKSSDPNRKKKIEQSANRIQYLLKKENE